MPYLIIHLHVFVKQHERKDIFGTIKWYEYLEVGGAYQEEGQDVGDEENDYREPERRVPRGIGLSLRLKSYDGSSSWPEWQSFSNEA